jgi:hypothetical protein
MTEHEQGNLYRFEKKASKLRNAINLYMTEVSHWHLQPWRWLVGLAIKTQGRVAYPQPSRASTCDVYDHASAEAWQRAQHVNHRRGAISL